VAPNGQLYRGLQRSSGSRRLLPRKPTSIASLRETSVSQASEALWNTVVREPIGTRGGSRTVVSDTITIGVWSPDTLPSPRLSIIKERESISQW
jgi:hypothetical protein